MSKNGGPAFPAQPIWRIHDLATIDTERHGMSLRDYFAAAALTALINNGYRSDEVVQDASAAYEIADAMLAERARGDKTGKAHI